MANTFYFDACSVDARFSPYSGEYVQKTIGGNNSKLQFMEPKGKPILGPHSFIIFTHYQAMLHNLRIIMII